jgi:hypothetical protein
MTECFLHGFVSSAARLRCALKGAKLKAGTEKTSKLWTILSKLDEKCFTMLQVGMPWRPTVARECAFVLLPLIINPSFLNLKLPAYENLNQPILKSCNPVVRHQD